MISPRSDFRKSPHAKGWQSLVDSNQFQAAVAAAKLEMDLRNRSAMDMATAAARHWKTEGALEFLSLLMNLTSTDVPPKKPLRDNLDHKL